MCGITGFINSDEMHNDVMQSVINKMTESLGHRGPDGHGVWIDNEKNIALGHRRLSIIDLTTHGAQPMTSNCKRYSLVYNGEIYNYSEIKKELDEIENIDWQSNSDTEVVLYAVKYWGLENAINKFIGMFAFALWDASEKSLFLVRDRLGIKPLYWGKINNVFLFASELKALSFYPEINLNVDLNSVSAFMRHNYIPEEQSIYKNVYKLIPGSYLVYKEGAEPLIKKYWNLGNIVSPENRFNKEYSEQLAVEKIESLISDSVDKRMISDVSLGAFLSGGIDSSTVVALMQKNSTSAVKTFSIGFNEAEFNEAPYAKEIAKHLGTDHTEFYVSDKDAMDVIPLLPDIYDEPFSDSSQIPTFLVSKLTKEHVTVALSGDGGDEVFAGYNRYYFANSISKKLKLMTGAGRFLLKNIIENASTSTWDKIFGFMPDKYAVPQAGDKLYKLAAAISKNELDIYKHLVSHWNDIDKLVPGSTCHEGIFSTDYSHELKNGFVEAMQYIDTKTYLPDDILTKVDRASMAVSLEVRVPLLDHRLVEYAWKLPLSMKMKNGKSKWLLRQVLNKYVPSELVDRPKMGFGVPIGHWLRGPLRDWAESLLDERKIREYGILNYEPIKLKWDEHLSGKRNWQYHIWDILMFQAWSEKWL
jgi:asparagine synthase (glutamine-hydrolysing)